VTRRRRRTPDPAEALAADRPRRTLIAPGASPEEAAAIVAALERFVADRAAAPPPPVPRSRPGGWLRAALREGVGRGVRRHGGWGDPHP
jgi:hypothetical protein